MNEVAMTILEGSEGFFKQQYGTIFKYAFVFAIFISTLYGVRENPLNLPEQNGKIPVHGFRFALLIGFSFAFGAICSAFSGLAGLWVSVRTNIRVAQAARDSYNTSLQLAFAGGYFGAAINIALAILGVSGLFIVFYSYLTACGVNVLHHLEMVPLLMVGFGFGASFVAMFAQLGGGIYTKAADVGADLVGKLEKDFPEDDERNPAVIADLVGDNVGDCAGQAADLFESITAEIISAMILGATLAKLAHLDTLHAVHFMFFPLALHSLDLFASTIGFFFVKTEDNRGTYIFYLRLVEIGRCSRCDEERLCDCPDLRYLRILWDLLHVLEDCSVPEVLGFVLCLWNCGSSHFLLICHCDPILH